ncbi:TatD family hydrolase [Leadbetterella sp. DM7]|uniref:TatD family hydrolase n=1 Tax=Leadbetterella sp. DM7 TaxID=3235085 RepID=UPI00349E9D71
MIDTHAHIYDEQFDADKYDMLERARQAGIEQIWMPNCDSETISRMYALEREFPGRCLAMIGLHPVYVNERYEEELKRVEEELEKRKFIMIGEIGLDFYWDLAFTPQQETAFVKQLELARAYDLPVCIHSRNSKDNSLNAIQRCCDLIEDFGWNDLRGIFHCFSGTPADAERVTGLHFLLGIGGVATFKNGGLDRFLAEIPLEKIVLETDAPYLAPVPHRGKRNEPAYLELVVDKLSEIYATDPARIRDVTTRTARSLIHES